MSPFARHVLVPAVAPLAIVGLSFTPVTLFGCVNRGYAALAVVLVSLVAGIVTGLLGLRARARKDASSGWWIASTCILALPALLVLGPLG